MSPTPSSPSSASSALVDRSTGRQVALEQVRVEARVVDLSARVIVCQAYRNRESVPLEVVYVFPLDEGAAVCGFEAVVDGVRYVGRAMERDEAFAKYDDAMEAGHGAYLLDEERADVFTASLGNLRPGAEVVLSITYVTELASEGADARFTLPTTVSPRYAPDPDTRGVGPTPAEALNPPVALEVPYAFSFEMELAMGGALRGVRSPSHPIEVELDGTRARVRLAQRSAPMDRDLVVVIAADGLDVPHATVERGERGSAILLSFLPRFEKPERPAEVVFLIDRSGSMQGDSIAEVRNALQLCLRSLVAGCRFNIVSFGSEFKTFFPSSRPYDERTLAEASAFVAEMDADMGGTEILPALYAVFRQPLIEGLARHVILLTDGEVTNTDEIIEHVGKHAETTRFFTFGIGAGASHHLVRGVARASRGAAEFINPGERVEAKVMRQFRRLFAPELAGARVEWRQPGARPSADEVPPVFDGERVTIYALADEVEAGVATLGGTLDGRPVTFEIPVDPANAVAGDTIATLAARRRIRTLEERGDYLESRGSRQRRARAGLSAAAEIVALAVKYQLCSRETSFVAIEERETPVTERAELRRIPVALTSGWGGVGRRWPIAAAHLVAPMAIADRGPMLSRGADLPADDTGEFVACDAAFMEMPSSESYDLPEYRVPARRRPDKKPAVRPHDRLVALQRADGSWDLTREFAEQVGKALKALEALLRGAAGDRKTARRALATALAIAWLEKHASPARDEWAMLADKAQRWLSACGALPAGGESWRALAARIVE